MQMKRYKNQTIVIIALKVDTKVISIDIKSGDNAGIHIPKHIHALCKKLIFSQ
jgi:hypothetical protein